MIDRTALAFRKFLGPLLAAGVGIALTLALFVFAREDAEGDARLRFDRQAADAKHVIERRLHSYVGVTYGLKALFGARDSLSRAEFHRYVASLNLKQNYPGFVLLNYARHIKASEKRQLEERVRRDTSVDPRGYPKFSIRPPGVRPEHHVLIYLEPMEGNEFAFGLDISVTPQNVRAQTHTRDTGELVSSGRLISMGEERYVALAMRMAVYRSGAPVDTVEQRRAAYIGTVGAGYHVRRLMAGVLDETTMKAMSYRLYDVGPAGARESEKAKPALLYDSAQTAPGAPREDFESPRSDPLFRSVHPLELAGRNWELHFSGARGAFVGRVDEQLPWMVLAAGLFTSALLFAVLYAFASSRERAVAIAREITSELRESEERFRSLTELSSDWYWEQDENLRFVEFSAGAEQYDSAASHIGKTRWELPGVDSSEKPWREHRAALEAHKPFRNFEFQRLTERGEVLWISVSGEPVFDAQGRFKGYRGIGRSITERKRAEQIQGQYAAQVRDLLRRLVSVQEAERRRFAADLHDLVGQSLSVLGMGLETIRGLLSSRPSTRVETTFDDMGRLLKETMGAVRQVMSELRPPLLDDYGLYTAIESHARQFEQRTGLRVVLEGDAPRLRLAPEVELALFRIAQEALTNAAKHADASHARISLTAGAGRVRLVVEDDGRGIQQAAAANDPGPAGWGMAVMRERAEAVGGALRVEFPGRGTRIVVEIAARDSNHPG